MTSTVSTTAALGAAAAGGGIPRRQYGKGDTQLSIVGFGGIVVKDAEPAVASKVVADAVERGVNYFDVAPGYGNAEEKLGPALEPFRKDVFLACKTHERTAEAGAADLKRSLERLRTDHFDLYQLHAITDVKKDVDVAFGKGGVMETVLQAKKDGVIRNVGFSAHSIDAAFAALDRYDFDSILVPINFAAFLKNDFGPQLIKRAQEKGASVLALKAMAKEHWKPTDPNRANFPKTWYEPLLDPAEAELGLRFTLSQPITAALPPGDETLFRQAMDYAERFKPVTEAETDKLRAMAQDLDAIFPIRQ